MLQGIAEISRSQMDQKSNFDILKECEGAKKIGISGHIRPDGIRSEEHTSELQSHA